MRSHFVLALSSMGKKGRIELRASAETPDYVSQAYRPPSSADSARSADPSPDLLEARQTVGGGILPQAGQYSPEERPSASAAEVHVYLLYLHFLSWSWRFSVVRRANSPTPLGEHLVGRGSHLLPPQRRDWHAPDRPA